VNKHLDFWPVFALPTLRCSSFKSSRGSAGDEAAARTAASSILLLSSGGELLPSDVPFRSKARVLFAVALPCGFLISFNPALALL
jgi:hypothetical protein